MNIINSPSLKKYLLDGGVPSQKIDEYIDVLALMTEEESVREEHLKYGRIRLMHEFDDEMLRTLFGDYPSVYVYTECGKEWVLSQKQQQMFHADLLGRMNAVMNENVEHLPPSGPMDCTAEERAYVLSETLRAVESLIEEKRLS